MNILDFIIIMHDLGNLLINIIFEMIFSKISYLSSTYSFKKNDDMD